MPRIDPALIPKKPTLEFERQFWQVGIQFVAGIDEAGRGALAGPVTAAAVILPPQGNLERDLAGVRDSKQMTALQRETCSTRIYHVALAYGVGFASHEEIDAHGIVPATRLAVQRAIATLSIQAGHLLLDYLLLPDLDIPQTSLIKGDARSLTIAAASVIAKTSRDALMIELDAQYPGYGLAAHKGYGTQAHRQAIERLGPAEIHRRTFAPVRLQVSKLTSLKA